MPTRFSSPHISHGIIYSCRPNSTSVTTVSIVYGRVEVQNVILLVRVEQVINSLSLIDLSTINTW